MNIKSIINYWFSSYVLLAYLLISSIGTFILLHFLHNESISYSLLMILFILVVFFIKFVIISVLTKENPDRKITPINYPILVITIIIFNQIFDIYKYFSLRAGKFNDMSLLKKIFLYIYDRGTPWASFLQNVFFVLILFIVIRIFTDKESSSLDMKNTGWKVTVGLSVVYLFDILIRGFHKFSGDILYNSGIIAHYIGVSLIEETVYRRFLTGSLLKLLKDPRTAIVLGGIVFGLCHIPFYVRGDRGLLDVTLTYLSETTMNGIIWGYLYYRTKSILPGVITHTLANLF